MQCYANTNSDRAIWVHLSSTSIKQHSIPSRPNWHKIALASAVAASCWCKRACVHKRPCSVSLVCLGGRMLVWSLGFAANCSCWKCRLVPPKKRPVSLQIRRRRHNLQPLSARLLGVQRGRLQTLRLPTRLRHSHRPVCEQVGHYVALFQWPWPSLYWLTNFTDRRTWLASLQLFHKSSV